jgi:hypothetical protein
LKRTNEKRTDGSTGVRRRQREKMSREREREREKEWGGNKISRPNVESFFVDGENTQ